MEKTGASYVGTHVVLTGPIKGTVTTADGTVYDVTEPVVEVRDGHQIEVADLIGARYAAEGHPDHDADTPFVHIPYTAPSAPEVVQ